MAEVRGITPLLCHSAQGAVDTKPLLVHNTSFSFHDFHEACFSFMISGMVQALGSSYRYPR